MIGLLRRASRYFSTTIFDRLLDKSIPSQAVYEDELVVMKINRFMLLRISCLRLQCMCSSYPKSRMDSREFQK